MNNFCETKSHNMTFYGLYVLVLQTQTRKMIIIFAIFFKFFENFLSFFEIFQLQGPGNLIKGLIIGHCIVPCNNGLVFNI